ncbi:hypothetical protein MLD38_038810 [Melastoma candidum]|uniref:Uncharacterized protein n=1 Tax=Melastoma candidum TaxID=119954 RepID=A0ACB9L1J3_9MYRT|nr:hypothetical protein MLD38_038810 [Melastoma candidum]
MHEAHGDWYWGIMPDMFASESLRLAGLPLLSPSYTSYFPHRDNMISRSYYTAVFSLPIHIRGTGFPVKVEKLHNDDAISFYNDKLPKKHLYPMDVDIVLGKAEPKDMDLLFLGRRMRLQGLFLPTEDKIYGEYCLKLQTTEPVEETFGFLLLYSLHGEGPRLVELMRSVVCKSAEKVARTIKHCKTIPTEVSWHRSTLRTHPARFLYNLYR